LIKSSLFLQTQNADRLQYAQRAQRIGVGGVFRFFEQHRDMALRRKIVDLVRLHLLNDANQTAGVGHVAIVENKLPAGHMRVLVEMIDTVGIKERGAALDAMPFIIFT
jgi:hypothetical protein